MRTTAPDLSGWKVSRLLLTVSSTHILFQLPPCSATSHPGYSAAHLTHISLFNFISHLISTHLRRQ